MADMRFRCKLRITPRIFRALMAAFLVSGLCQELASENVTLTTYYPAPSGVYTQMITTSNTFLARDTNTNSGRVGVGTTSMPTALLTVGDGAMAGGSLPGLDLALHGGAASYIQASDGTRSVFMGADGSGYGMVGTYTSSDMVVRANNSETIRVGSNRNVGIGNIAPLPTDYPLHVYSNVGGWTTVIQNTNNNAMAYFSHSGGYGAYIDGGPNASAGTYILDVNKSGTPYLYVRGDGNVGVGTAGPGTMLEVRGGLGAYHNCLSISNAQNVGCAGYVTILSGFIAKYTILPAPDNANTTAPEPSYLCCPCPAGGCPSF